MKQSIKTRIGPFFLLLFFCLMASASYGQTKVVKSKTNQNSGSHIISFTKTIIIDNGGVLITPESGSVDYTVYDQNGKTGAWEQTQQGKVLASKNENVKVCTDAGQKIKVEFTAACDECAVVDTGTHLKCN